MFLYTVFNTVKPFDILVLLLTTISLYITYFYYKYFTRINPLPGPIPIPFFNGLLFIRNDFDDWIFELNKKYGDIFELNLLNKRQIGRVLLPSLVR